MKSLSIGELFELIDVCEAHMRRHRATRKKLLRAFAGPMYCGDDHTREPINMHYGLAAAWLPNLAVNQPRNLVTTTKGPLRPVATMLGMDLDHLYTEIAYNDTLRMVTMDALVGPAIIKTGLCSAQSEHPGGEDAPGGYLHDTEQAFADRVSPDDYGIDPTCHKREQAWIEYDTYRLPLNFMQRNTQLYNPESVATLTETHYLQQTQRAERISRSGPPVARSLAEILKIIDVRDVWVPRENLVVTIPAGLDAPKVILREVVWDGPERGPYEMLGFAHVPDNVLPVPLMGVLHDLFVLQNRMAAKAGRQASRRKNITIVDASAEQEAQRLRDSSDADVLTMEAMGDKIMHLQMGGVAEDLYAHLAWVEQQYSRIGGNTDLIGGLQAKSKTLGQDQMLDANVQIKLGDARAQVGLFAKRVAEKLAFYIWNDQARETPLALNTGASEPSPVLFGPLDREGDLLDYEFDIDVHSMMLRDPTQQYVLATRWLTEIATPLAPLAQMQGLMLDVSHIAEMTAGWLQMPELAEVFVPMPQEPMMEEEGGGGSSGSTEAGQPAGRAEQGGNVNVNVPRQTPAGREPGGTSGSGATETRQMEAV